MGPDHAEMAPAKMRGQLNVLFQLLITVGAHRFPFSRGHNLACQCDLCALCRGFTTPHIIAALKFSYNCTTQPASVTSGRRRGFATSQIMAGTLTVRFTLQAFW